MKKYLRILPFLAVTAADFWILPLFLDATGLQMAQSSADLLTFCCAIPIQLRVLRSLNGDKPRR